MSRKPKPDLPPSEKRGVLVSNRAIGARQLALFSSPAALEEVSIGMKKRTPTTKDVGLLRQLHEMGQLTLAPEFQRNAVWPKAAKAYLIDTILHDQPIPPIFLQRIQSAQTGRPQYAVIDGQQRLRAIFEFMDDKFRLSESAKDSPYYRKRYSELAEGAQGAIGNYALDVQELAGYNESDIKDVFARMNKYVVKLSPQELRHAGVGGKFGKFAERLGGWPVWKDQKIFSQQQRARMRATEFVAELSILLIEGPQDKKSVVDLYYAQYKEEFAKAQDVEALLRTYIKWIGTALPAWSSSRYRSPTDLYSLIGALHLVSDEGARLAAMNASRAGEILRRFELETRADPPIGEAARYVAAASRQTDNIQPRNTRISVLADLLKQV